LQERARSIDEQQEAEEAAAAAARGVRWLAHWLRTWREQRRFESHRALAPATIHLGTRRWVGGWLNEVCKSGYPRQKH